MFKTKSLRKMCGLRLRGRVRKVGIRKRCEDNVGELGQAEVKRKEVLGS